jgi:hypothetical protein
MTHILPEENYAICVATNYGGKDCDQACQAAHMELVKRVHRVKEKLAAPRRAAMTAHFLIFFYDSVPVAAQ